MYSARVTVLILLLVTVIVAECHRHERRDFKIRHESDSSRSQKVEEELPFSQKKFEKMLQKAILKIIMGELSTADQTLLKSFNYSYSDIQTIRDYELNKKSDEEKANSEAAEIMNQQKRKKKKKKLEEDLEAFNRKALEDYESLDPIEQPLEEEKILKEQTLHERFDEAMKPHVIFQIRHDDSEFDSNSEESAEKFRFRPCKELKTKEEAATSTTTGSVQGEPFRDFARVLTPAPMPYLKVIDKEKPREDVNQIPQVAVANETNLTDFNETNESDLGIVGDDLNVTTDETEKRIYKGLQWVDDDVYKVIPEAMESYNFENEENGNYDYDEDQIAYDPSNDTMENFRPPWDMPKDDPVSNLTSYERLMLAQRRLQGQKAIEDIKLRVLVMTGRFNHTSNQVQKERLTMFLPSCQIPRNTDQEVWSDPYSMNIYFQLNLTAIDHIAAARLRIFNLPQENLISSTSTTFDIDEEDEKKIRISVYFYTKALKKHRIVKKRLMDSVVTSLTSTGNHLALDVRQALRFWRRSSRYSHGNGSNHGLVVQVEDQDGRPLKPAAYIQQPSCQATNLNTDEKAYHSIPALYVRACSRYIRVINGKIQTYYYCKKS